MTAIAAMIDRIDQEMGRMVADLKQAGELDNTMILFVSDNGACPYDRSRNQRSINQKPWDPTVRWSDSTGWAWARNAPFRLYKQNQFEGGICTPAIVHWPAGLKTRPGSVVGASSIAPIDCPDVLDSFSRTRAARGADSEDRSTVTAQLVRLRTYANP